MEIVVPAHQVRWKLVIDSGRGILRGFCIDTLTQRRYDLEIPIDAAHGLIAGLEEFMNAHPDLFADVADQTVTSDDSTED